MIHHGQICHPHHLQLDQDSSRPWMSHWARGPAALDRRANKANGINYSVDEPRNDKSKTEARDQDSPETTRACAASSRRQQESVLNTTYICWSRPGCNSMSKLARRKDQRGRIDFVVPQWRAGSRIKNRREKNAWANSAASGMQLAGSSNEFQSLGHSLLGSSAYWVTSMYSSYRPCPRDGATSWTRFMPDSRRSGSPGPCPGVKESHISLRKYVRAID